jgi:uncharacterized protein YhbP (UPF0306 family)
VRVRDPSEVAREILDSVQYLTLATADERGRPWASPVWFAHEGYVRFLWVSKPEARHSRNLATRPEVGIVVFDSTVALGHGQAVYIEASAAELEGAEAERSIGVFSHHSEARGGPAWTIGDIRAPAGLRLYGAIAAAQFVLGPNDERIAVGLG